jgi:histidyl-tRNA synthetase
MFVNFGEQETNYLMPVVARLRENGIRAEIYPDAVKMKKQMQYANAKAIPFVVLAGEDEIQSNTVTLKNMATGEQARLSAEELVSSLCGV